MHREGIPARATTYADLERPLSPDIQRSIDSLGITSLYSHQAAAIDSPRNGENVVIATPLAGGKSLCYHLLVLDALLDDQTARALNSVPNRGTWEERS